MEPRLVEHLVYVPRGAHKLLAQPPLPEDSVYMYQLIPSLCFSDPNYHPIYFIVPSTRPAPRLFGISLVYPKHALVLLTHTLYFIPLTRALKSLYPLFTTPKAPLLTAMHATLSCVSYDQVLIEPPANFIASVIRLMKLVVLPFRTIVYSSSPDDVSRSVLFLLHSIPGVFLPASKALRDLGFPLTVDAKRPVIPFLPSTLIDCIVGLDGFLVGTSSALFAEPSSDWDVVVDIQHDKVLCNKQIAQVIAETSQDRILLVRLKELLIRKQIPDIMNLLAGYYIGLVRSLLPFIDAPNPLATAGFPTSPAVDYGIPFLKLFVNGDVYADWKASVNRDEATKVPACHPCHLSDDSKATKALKAMTATVAPDWMISASILAESYAGGFSSYWRKTTKM